MVKKDIQGVHLVRAVASLAVMLTHFFGDARIFTVDYFYYGYLGVEMFFILSGYIISHSLPKQYKINNFKTFILKRLIRIEPPYIFSIILIIALNLISYSITGYSDNNFDFKDFIFHLAYLNNFGLGHYYNHNYWTLGIEFQFYILLGLIFPFVKNTTSVACVFLVMLVISCIKISLPWQIIPQFLSVFGLGMLLYYYEERKNINSVVLFVFFCWFCIQIYICLGYEALIASIITMVMIHFWGFKNRIILFFSKISFSLYLIHTPVGTRVINLGLRIARTSFQKYLLVLLEIIISIVAAYIFYILIEKPSIKWAKKVAYFHS